jgi:hypothetical protein
MRGFGILSLVIKPWDLISDPPLFQDSNTGHRAETSGWRQIRSMKKPVRGIVFFAGAAYSASCLHST